jgi:hypothetical protein
MIAGEPFQIDPELAIGTDGQPAGESASGTASWLTAA